MKNAPNKFYLVEYYNFLNCIAYCKTRDAPIVKSVNGGRLVKVIRQKEITEADFNAAIPWQQLRDKYFPETQPVTTDVTQTTEQQT